MVIDFQNSYNASSMKVLKFGGSSVAKPERIKNVIYIIQEYYKRGEQFTVVFSAFGGVTDALINMSQQAAKGDESYLEDFEAFSSRHKTTAEELLSGEHLKVVLSILDDNSTVLKNLLHGILLLREASPRTMDYVLSFGERTSALIISYAFQQNGINARFLDARKLIKTDNTFGSAKVDFDMSYANIKEHYNSHPEVQIVTGFISSAKGGLTTTLGRGGSDYTAALLAAGLNAEIIEIWTDVDGVLTADPRKVQKAFTIPEMTYAEAMEMSHFGAKVIYPPTLQPALDKQIPLAIKNTFNPGFKGTLISKHAQMNGHPVRGISSIGDISLLTLSGSGLYGVPGIAGRLFNSLAQAEINIVLITQGSSESSISFAVKPKDAKKAKKCVESEFIFELQNKAVEPVIIEKKLSVIAIIGENMRYQPGIAGRLFQALGKNGINCIAIAQGSSELNVSVVIPQEDEQKALNALHQGFFLSKTKELNLFMAGTGLIGSTLIRQIQEHALYLKEKQSVEINIIGLANSRKMIFHENGITMSDWKDQLDNTTEKSDIGDFVTKMKEFNLPNSVFVDNTASEKVANYYEAILNSSISISTPNKIATSSSYPQYLRLKSIAAKRGVQFMYETNVGAGLPVINTLHDLINSGDRILKIEGVLSGSLSYIFNSFNEGVLFSDIVKQARDLGFTEPDPRIDLMGVDVRRKIIILARETGIPLEAHDVDIESILPEACVNAPDVETFFEEVEKANQLFEDRRAAAEKEGKVLRIVAILENEKASIKLCAVDSKHPFYSLSGSDNMIVFTTERYKERPLVVRGPGAGAEVTAAGVFSEVIKIGNFLS